MTPLRRQITYSVLLLPITFALWFAAGGMLAAPAAWVAEQVLLTWLTPAIQSVGLQGTNLVVETNWGILNDQVTTIARAGNQILLEVDTRLTTYGIALYAALLGASNDSDGFSKFTVGLLVLWAFAAFGFIAMVLQDLASTAGTAFTANALAPPASLIALCYQFSVLLLPTLVPIIVWAIQLRGSPLWESLSAAVAGAPDNDPPNRQGMP